MIAFRQPSPETIDRFIRQQQSCELTYRAVGATASQLPAGFVHDHTRVTLGHGEPVFAQARLAMQTWQQFQLGWLQACPSDTPLAKDEVVVVMAYVMGMWWLNACRIVYVVDEFGPVVRYGFAYGTLPGHAECGEERFLIEWDRSSDVVSYGILAFSRPKHYLVKLGYPMARRMQKRFARESAAAMMRQVRANTARSAV